jgi:transposase
MTPAMLTQLRRLERDGKITFYEQCQVAQAQWIDNAWRICCTNSAVHECIHHQAIDRIWLATGSQLDATAHPLLQQVLNTHPLEIVNGLPVVDEYLRWQGCELFVMGGLAALQVGPTARNLSGARATSDRIISALTKASLSFSNRYCSLRDRQDIISINLRPGVGAMAAPYSDDLRQKVIAAIDRGERKSHVCRLFKLSRNTLDTWLKRRRQTGSLSAKRDYQRGPTPKIADLEAFRHFAQQNGHLTQQAMAAQWRVPVSAVTLGKALKRIRFTRKKRPTATGSAMKSNDTRS